MLSGPQDQLLYIVIPDAVHNFCGWSWVPIRTYLVGARRPHPSGTSFTCPQSSLIQLIWAGQVLLNFSLTTKPNNHWGGWLVDAHGHRARYLSSRPPPIRYTPPNYARAQEGVSPLHGCTSKGGGGRSRSCSVHACVSRIMNFDILLSKVKKVNCSSLASLLVHFTSFTSGRVKEESGLATPDYARLAC